VLLAPVSRPLISLQLQIWGAHSGLSLLPALWLVSLVQVTWTEAFWICRSRMICTSRGHDSPQNEFKASMSVRARRQQES
jgi:hypothetical protein